VSSKETSVWLSKTDLKAQTESEMIAAECHWFQARYPAKRMLKTETGNKSELCQSEEEKIDDI
jgi:hypothetical protein